jgi:coiled-coil domain-containing protein 12
MSLSAEAEKRKERLLALKKRKRGQIEDSEQIPSEGNELTTNDSTQPENDTSAPYVPFAMGNNNSLPLSGRNYDASTRTTKLGFQESPLSKLPEEFETVEEVAIDLAIQALHEADKSNNQEGEVDLFALQPNRPNWDLKRNVEKKLERLKPKTDAAIAKLIRERLKTEKKKGEDIMEGDLSKIVERREQEDKEEAGDDDL